MSYIFSLMPCCENCPEFEVEDNESIVTVDNDDSDGYFESPTKELITHRISCVHDIRCRNMLRQLKEKI